MNEVGRYVIACLQLAVEASRHVEYLRRVSMTNVLIRNSGRKSLQSSVRLAELHIKIKHKE